MSIKLKYTGGGFGGALPGVPARDLSDADIAMLGINEEAMIKSGLYVRIEDTRAHTSAGKMTRRSYADKATRPTESDKDKDKR